MYYPHHSCWEQPPYGTRGKRPLQLWRSWDQVNLIPSNFCKAVIFSLGTVESLQCSPELLTEFSVRSKEEQGQKWVKHGWSNNGRRGRDGEEQEGDHKPSHLRSLPTFQPWLHLCSHVSHAVCIPRATVHHTPTTC